jgi:hypothetical protein
MFFLLQKSCGVIVFTVLINSWTLADAPPPKY